MVKNAAEIFPQLYAGAGVWYGSGYIFIMNWQRSFNGNVAAVCDRRGRHSQSAATIRCHGVSALCLLVLGALCAVSARADVAPNPYTPIVTRNVFGLVPIPTNAPVDTTPEAPPPKITPNGIMTLFGKLQVLFKVAGVTHAGQPPKDESYVLSEGDRQDDIEVQMIDEKAAMITFNNHGVVQKLALVAGTASAGSAAPAASNFPRPGLPAPGMAPGAGGNTPIGFGGRFGRTRTLPGASSPAPSSPSLGGASENGGDAANNNQSATTGMTPEQQVILIEAQRQQYIQENNPIANMLPNTPLTQQVKSETGGDSSSGDVGGPR